MDIGDRVIVNGEYDFRVFVNSKGRIIDISGFGYGIEFDEYIGGHNCGGVRGKMGHCWYVYKEMVTLEKDTIEDFKKELDKITL